MRRWLGSVCASASLLALAVVSCTQLPGEPIAFKGVIDDEPELPPGLGVGADCSEDACRAGLACVDGICQPSGELPLGARCLIGPECADGALCVVNPLQPRLGGVCVAAGDGALGEGCSTDLDCSSGLRCSFSGLSLVCAPAGTGDHGAECAAQSDCYQGLYCADGECSLPAQPYGFPLWKGVSCAAPTDDDVEALFAIPGARGTPDGADFFSLPYPNDARLRPDGTLDLSGFPTPGPELLGVDMVQRYVDALEEHARGFSANGAVIFRFSGAVDYDTLRFDDAKRPVALVDLDDESTALPGVTWTGHGARSRYVCDDWLAVRLGLGEPMTPGHTYAAWLTTDARTPAGARVKRSPQFAALLAEAAPTGDPALARAHARYAPLREYLDERGIDPESILVAAVFTVDDPIAPMRELAAAVAASPAPTTSEWVKCEAGAPSPCPQAEGNRACGRGTSDYDEYQALVRLPIFQEGTPPYELEGGAIQSASVRREQICLSLTVPRAPMPAGGWPLVVYGHGTGGSYRSHVRSEVAGALARGATKFAVVGIDQVQHGPRRGESTESPNNLFFNFVNPDAARGNPLQGAADQLGLLRLFSSFALTGAQSGGDAIQIDPTKIVLYGHSQGSTHASLALPFSSYPGAVLSGNGGSLAQSLLHKSSPVDIAAALPIVLQDPDESGKLFMREFHPALGLLQHYIDPADPVDFAPLLFVRPESGQSPKHVFQTFGLGDTYSPASTMAAFIYAARKLDLAEPPARLDPSNDETLNLTPLASVSGNFTDGESTVTAACRQYAPPAGEDGHYVVFDVPAAVDDVVGFLSDVAEGRTPIVPAR